MTSDNHKPLPDDATAQEVFDAIVTRMVAQGRQSVDDNGDCAYAGQDGLACAAGCIIPRELCERIEGDDIHILCLGPSTIFEMPEAVKANALLVERLQLAHDSAKNDFVPEFCGRARDVAQKHGLTFPEVTP